MTDINEIKNKALQILSRRQQTEKEMQLKLSKKGYDSDSIAKVIDDLREEKLLSDNNYGKDFIYFQLKKAPIGRHLLKHKLMRRGIDKDLAEKLVTDNYTTKEEIAGALRLANRKKDTLIDKKKERIYRYLSNRGFGGETIIKVTEKLNIK